MKTKLLSAIAMPAALMLGSANVMAQEMTPPPAERAPAPEATTPAPTPAPSATIPAPSADAAAGAFSTAQSADEWRSSKLVGLSVYNQANEKVGDINDLIVGSDGKISHAVIGVGGFLGLGEKLVGVDYGTLQLNRDADGKLRVMMDTTKEALQNAPEFKYHEDAKVAQ